MKLEHHILNELHAFRYTGDDPKYGLVISHGLGGHGGIYDRFCEHHAPKGVDIWSYDAPGHGRSTTNRPRGQWQMSEWAQASRTCQARARNDVCPAFCLVRAWVCGGQSLRRLGCGDRRHPHGLGRRARRARRDGCKPGAVRVRKIIEMLGPAPAPIPSFFNS